MESRIKVEPAAHLRITAHPELPLLAPSCPGRPSRVLDFRALQRPGSSWTGPSRFPRDRPASIAGSERCLGPESLVSTAPSLCSISCHRARVLLAARQADLHPGVRSPAGAGWRGPARLPEPAWPWPEPAHHRHCRHPGSCRCSLRCYCCCPLAVTRWKVSSVGVRFHGLRCLVSLVWAGENLQGGPVRAERTSEKGPPPSPAPGAGGLGGEDAPRDASEAPACSETSGPRVVRSRAV